MFFKKKINFLKFAFNFFNFLSLKFIVADLAPRGAKMAKFSNGFKISFKICLIFQAIFKFFKKFLVF